MIKNYIKIAWRNLLKHKSFSAINILGLSIGIAACMIIFVYVQHELTFDQYNKNAKRIARVTTTLHAPESDIKMATGPALLSTVMLKDFPEVEAAVRIEKSSQSVRLGNEYLKEENFYNSEQSIFSVFSFDVLEGSLKDALTMPDNIVITNTMAKKYFGADPAVGKRMLVSGGDKLVTAVVKDRPANSDFKIEALMAHDFSTTTEWMDGFSAYIFVLLKGKPDFRAFEKKLMAVSTKDVQAELDRIGATNYKTEFFAEPLANVHYSKDKQNDTPKGNRQYNYVFSVLAIFILMIALLNYINLSTARATERAREVGIRKVSGALPFQLMRQFLFESFFLIVISSLLAVVLLYLGIPLLNRLLQTELSINLVRVISFATIVFVVTVLLAGIYPAFVLSSFKPVKVLKGNWKNSGRGLLLRKSVTVIQFSIAAALIMGTTVIYNQLRYIQNKNLGFDKDQLLNIYLPRDSMYMGTVSAFVHELRRHPEIRDVTVGGGLVGDGLTIGTTFAEDNNGKKREMMCNFFPVDPHFLSVFNVRLLQGRNLSDNYGTDKNEGFLVNEAFVKMMGWKSPLGKSMEGWDHKGKVIGVVQNVYYKSIHNLVDPLVMVYNTVPVNITTVKVNPQHLSVIKNIYRQYFPTIAMNYSFFDEIINKQYETDRMTMSLFNDFTLLAIFICGLGMYGLVSLIVIQRSKEIGIRKVLGATITQLLAVLSGDFLKLVCIALLVALPVAGVVMHKWLATFAYHTPLSWWMFFIPAALVIAISVAVISREVIRAALANPVKSLRTE